MVKSPPVVTGRRKRCPSDEGETAQAPNLTSQPARQNPEGQNCPYLYLPRKSLPPLQLQLESGVLVEAAPWVSGLELEKC